MKPHFTITSLKIGEYEVPVPHGLSELLNNAGAWRESRTELTLPNDYERKVEMRNGKLYTVLTKKQKNSLSA